MKAHNGWRLAHCVLQEKLNKMEQFDLDKWLIERYSPLTLERIKKAHFNYDNVLEILNEALRQPPDIGSLQDRLFELANDFAVAKKGEVAVKLHSIHNGLQ
jgi:phosphoserine phosphatase